MSSIRALLIPVLLVVCAMAYADEREVRQAAEDLLTLTNVERNLDEVRTQIGQMMVAQMDKMNIPDSMRDKLRQHQQRILALVFDELSFPKMKDSYLDVYTSVLTPEELTGIVAFYKTPIGRSFAEKQSALTKRMMDIAQTRVQTLLPRMQKMNEEFIADLKKESQPH